VSPAAEHDRVAYMYIYSLFDAQVLTAVLANVTPIRRNYKFEVLNIFYIKNIEECFVVFVGVDSFLLGDLLLSVSQKQENACLSLDKTKRFLGR